MFIVLKTISSLIIKKEAIFLFYVFPLVGHYLVSPLLSGKFHISKLQLRLDLNMGVSLKKLLM